MLVCMLSQSFIRKNSPRNPQDIELPFHLLCESVKVSDILMFNRKSMANNEEVEPLDEAEQTKVLEDLKQLAANQTDKQRRLFYIVFLGIAFVFLVCLAYSVWWPWEMNHQSHFQEFVPHWIISLFYLSSTYCYCIAAAIVKVILHFYSNKLLNLTHYLIRSESINVLGCQVSGLCSGSAIPH